jgi:hypothetical protein
MRETSSPLSAAGQEACALAALGALVFPGKADKTPLTEHGHLDATNDRAIIIAMWTRWPFAEICIRPTNSFIVLDVDVDPLNNGFKHFLELEGRDVFSLNTPLATTLRGGVHAYLKVRGLAGFKNTADIGGYNLDVRTSEGYVVAPSPGSGRRWINPPTGPWENAFEWILRETYRGKTRETSDQSRENAHFTAEWLPP